MPHNRNRLYLRFSSTKTIFFPFCVRSNIHNLHRYWFQICQTIVKNYPLLHRRRYKWLPWATDERWRTFLFWNQSPIYWRLVLVHAKRKAQSIRGFSFFICQVKFPIGFDVCCGFLRGNIFVINHVNLLFFPSVTIDAAHKNSCNRQVFLNDDNRPSRPHTLPHGTVVE